MRWCYACGDPVTGKRTILVRFGAAREYCSGCAEAITQENARSVVAKRGEAASDAQEKEVETVTLTDGAVIPRKAASSAAGWIWLDLKRIRDQDI